MSSIKIEVLEPKPERDARSNEIAFPLVISNVGTFPIELVKLTVLADKKVRITKQEDDLVSLNEEKDRVCSELNSLLNSELSKFKAPDLLPPVFIVDEYVKERSGINKLPLRTVVLLALSDTQKKERIELVRIEYGTTLMRFGHKSGGSQALTSRALIIIFFKRRRNN